MNTKPRVRAEAHRLRDPINGSRCIRCGQYWAYTSGPLTNFKIITKWCPDCVAVVLPVMGRVAA